MPKFSKAQIARRQRIALALLLVFTLGVLWGCSALLGNVFAPADTAFKVRLADNSAMQIAPTPKDASALSQLLDGITLEPEESMGIDVSNHQQEIDWEQVSTDGYQFAYIKATEGSSAKDPFFDANWSGAQANGLTVGAYHYFSLCSSGKEQAANFLHTVPVDDAALPPVLDLEFDGPCEALPEQAAAQAEIEDFLQAVEAAWGRRVVIYSSSQWRDHYGLPQSDGRPDWLYSDSGRPEQSDWSVWQLHFNGQVNGITGDVDIDVARVEQLRSHAEMSEAEIQQLQDALNETDN